MIWSIWYVLASLAFMRLHSGAIHRASESSAEMEGSCGDLTSLDDTNSILQVHASMPQPSSSRKKSSFADKVRKLPLGSRKARSRSGKEKSRRAGEKSAKARKSEKRAKAFEKNKKEQAKTEKAKRCRAERRLYGLSRLHSAGHAFTPECRGDQCGLKLPSNWSRFVHGKMPEILPADYSREIIKGKRWFNPSVVKLPRHLAEMFPNGRYLAIGNMVPAAKPFRIWPPNGTHLVVLNPKFQAIAEARLDLRNAQHGKDDKEIMQKLLADGRLLVDHNGHILIGFTPYSIRMLPSAHQYERHWQCHEFVALLRVSNMSDGSLAASVDYREMRMLDWPGERHDGDCLKNLGLISKPSSQIDVIVYVHPTRVAQFDVADLSADKANKSAYISALALNSLRSVSQSEMVPWEDAVKYQSRNAHSPLAKILPGFIHNGPHPIWVEELQEYLGIGHFVRGQGDIPGGCFETGKNENNHHYTNLFFTLSSGPNYHMKRISKREWCMPSKHNPKDCDTVQFVSGLLRDGDHLHVAYGTYDTSAFIARISVTSVLDSLQAFLSIGHSDPASKQESERGHVSSAGAVKAL